VVDYCGSDGEEACVRELTRVQVLRRGIGGGVVLAAGGGVIGLAAPAHAAGAADPTEDDLATLRLAASAELLAQSFYTRAIASKLFAAQERRLLERALANEREHYRTLAAMLGATAPVADDFEFAFPSGTFTHRGRMARVGSVIETAIVGVYAGGAGTLTVDTLRVQAGQIAASDARHLGVLANLRGGSYVGIAFPPVFDIEQASAVLDPFFGE
jgi:hypothetical protein